MNTITSIELSCGMPLIVERMGGVRSAAVSWLAPAGVALDPSDRIGLSALWSEMICRGAGGLDSRAHADALDRLGVNRTTSSGTIFLRLGATLTGERLDETLPLLVDMVRRPRFDAASLEPSRELALQSIQSLQDDPHERAMIAARETHLPDPLGRSTYGEESGLRASTLEDVSSGWSGRALPRGSILAMAGDVDASAVRDRMESLLSGWSGSAPEAPTDGSGPRGYRHVEDGSNQVQIVLVHDAPREADDESMLERVVVSALSGGMSGRLFTEVREKRGLCYAVSASYRSNRDFGLVTAYVGTTPERAQTSLDVLVEQLERMHTPEGAVTESEFERAIVGLKAGLVFSGESSGARASALASDYHRIGRPRAMEEILERIDAITLERVNEYLARRSMGRPSIVTLGPEPLTPPA